MKFSTAALALAAVMATASFASANGFGIVGNQDASSYLTLNTVTSAVAGSVEIRDNRLGTAGDVLGTVDVSAGANSNVRVILDQEPLGDVVAVLLDANGNAVATTDININR